MTQHGLPQNPAPDSQVYLYPYPSLPKVLEDGCFMASITTVSWIDSVAIQKCVWSMIHLFSFWFKFSLLLVSFHYHLVQVSSNLKTNKTSTILHASSIYHCMFFLFLCGLLESPPFRFDTFCCPSNLPTDTTWLLSYKSTETAYPKAVNDFLTIKASRQLVLSYLTSLRYLTSLSAFLFWDPLL